MCSPSYKMYFLVLVALYVIGAGLFVAYSSMHPAFHAHSPGSAGASLGVSRQQLAQASSEEAVRRQDPLALLQLRLARGEISALEFQRLAQLLREADAVEAEAVAAIVDGATSAMRAAAAAAAVVEESKSVSAASEAVWEQRAAAAAAAAAESKSVSSASETVWEQRAAAAAAALVAAASPSTTTTKQQQQQQQEQHQKQQQQVAHSSSSQSSRSEVIVEVHVAAPHNPAVVRGVSYDAQVTLSIEAADGTLTPSGWSTRVEAGGDGEPFTFTPFVGLIEGWSRGVLRMHEGERAVMHVPAKLG
jgi:hypothetical protein